MLTTLKQVLEMKLKNNIKFNSFINWFKKRYRDKRYYETDTQIFVHAGIDEEAGKLWKQLTSSEMFTNKFPLTTGGFFKRYCFWSCCFLGSS